MLSIARLDAGKVTYYTDTITSETPGYYTNPAESPGTWIGAGAADAGLAGRVGAADLAAVLAGRVGGLEPHDRRRAGFDVTLSAPKSVSLLFALGLPDIGDQVGAAHDRAVTDAVAYLEAHASWARRKHAGTELVATSGLVAAAFRHDTSRELDPQLHTHVVIANLVHGVDGRWSALHGHALYEHQLAAGYVYQASLRAALVETLGVSWGPVRNGAAELAAVPPAVLAEFSTRRAQVLDTLERWGSATRAAAESATLATRAAKVSDADRPALYADWSERAAQVGFDPTGLIGPPRPALGRDAAERAAAGAITGGLTARVSAFTRRDVVRAVAERLEDGAPLPGLEALCEGLLADSRVVGLDQVARDHTGAAEPDRRVAADGEGWWTTVELLAAEAALLSSAEHRAGEGTAVASPSALSTALAVRPTLSAEQRQVVERLVTSGDGVQVVVGRAGAGKTFALDAARQAWEASGHPVIGAAVAARAAAALTTEAAVPAVTVHTLLADLSRPEGRLSPGTVILVDEAGMVPTRQLADLLAAAARDRSAVVLIGDWRQLPEIRAGGAFRALAGRLGAAELVDNRRQTEAWERAALAELRHGSISAAIEAYAEEGRIVLADTAADARAAMVADWAARYTAGADAVMFAATRADVADLNARARVALAAAGHLDLAAACVYGERAFAPGETVIATRNDRRLGVRNGDRALVVSAGPGGLVVRGTAGDELALPATYAATHLEAGAAVTVHKAQGATVEYGFQLGTGNLYRELGYVGMSRARVETRMYLVAGDADDDTLAGAAPGSALEEVIGRLGVTRAQTVAHDRAEPVPGAGTLAELHAERDYLADRLLATMPSDPRPQLDLLAAGATTEGPGAGDADRLHGAASARDRWAETSAADDRRLLELDQAIRARRHDLGRIALAASPPHLLDTLGPPPAHGLARHAWASAASAVESYRDRAGITDTDTALGPRPARSDLAAEWDRVAASLDRAARTLGRDTRSRDRGMGLTG